MIEKQEEIIKNINNLDEVKRIKELKENLNSNEIYNSLINKKINNKEELIEVRKKLFQIDDFKEYQELYTELKLFFLKINKIIVSVVDKNHCKNHLN